MRQSTNFVALLIMAALLIVQSSAICSGRFSAEVRPAGGSTVHMDIDLPQIDGRSLSVSMDGLDPGSLPFTYRLPSGRDVQMFVQWVVIPAHGNVTAAILSQEGRVMSLDDAGFPSDAQTFSVENNDWNLPLSQQPDNSEPLPRLEPANAVSVGSPQIMRGVRMVPVAVYPVQYQVDGDFAISNDKLSVELQFDNAPGENEVFGPKRLSHRQSRLLRSMVKNAPQPRRDLAATSLSRMLVLFPEALEDESALEQLDAFVEWKRRMGYMVDVESVDAEGLTGEEIRDDIVMDYYEQDPPLDYLLLIGDDRFPTPVIRRPDSRIYEEELFFPAFVREEVIDDTTSLFYYMDLLYTTLEGDDELPDISLGRMWVPTAEKLAGALMRSVAYEQDPFMGPDEDGDWFKRGLFTVESDTIPLPHQFDLTQWGMSRMREVGYEDLILVAEIDENYTEEELSAESKVVLEEGVSIVFADNWLLGAAHPPWVHDEIARTDRMNPFLIMNGQFYENWITYLFFGAVTVDDLNGPVAALVTNHIDRTDNVQLLIGPSIQAMRYADVFTPGELFLASIMQMAGVLDHDSLDETIRLALHEEMLEVHVFGDPSVDIFTSIPIPLSVVHPDVYNVGATSVVLEVADEDDNPVRDAVACIRQVDGLVYVTHTDGGGFARFTVPEGLEEGELQITVHKHNYQPYLADLPVEALEVNLILAESGFDDSELGNDDGSFSNGEEVRLALSLRNSGEGDAAGVTALLFTDSPHLSFSENEIQFGDIGAGETVPFEGEVSLTLDADYSAGTPIRIQVDVDHDGDSYPTSFELNGQAPFLRTGGDLIAVQDFFPGENARLVPNIRNVGVGGVSGFEATLSSLDTLVTVEDETLSYLSIEADPDEENDPTAPEDENSFALLLSPYIFRGDTAHFELQLSAEDDYDTTLTFAVRVAGPNEAEPFGPDDYGYYCYDSGDTAWGAAPTYNWREINWDVEGYEVRGERFDLGDVGQNILEWDATAFLPLPENFSFVYYGETADSLVVCSNGWISPDTSAIRFSSSYNYPIPGMSAPEGQICPMWENLTNSTTERDGVFYHYFEDENLFVVEWSGVQTGGNPNDIDVSFQILLYDGDAYPTPTGDSEIIFQYREFESVPGFDTRTPYATIGIRNLDASGGLQYAYWNEYNERAHPVEDEFAIRFTTVLNQYGAVGGRLVQVADRQLGIGGAVIDHIWFEPVTTDEEGYFMLEALPPGEYENASIHADGFNGESFSFEIIAGQTADVGTLELTNPLLGEMEMTPMPFDQLSLRPDTSHFVASLSFENPGNGPLEYSTRIVNSDGSDPSPEFSRQYMDMTNIVDDNRIYGLAYTDSTFFISGRNGRNDPPRVYMVDYDGQLLSSFEAHFAVYNDNGIKRLAWDGTRLWGSLDHEEEGPIVLTFDLEGNLVRFFSSPFESFGNLALTYSPERHSLFLGDNSPDYLVEIDTMGNELNRLDLRHPGRIFNVTGLAWNPADPDLMPLYVHEDSVFENTHFPLFWKIDPETGDRMKMGFIPTDSLPGSIRDLIVLPDINQGYNTIAYLEYWGADYDHETNLRIYNLGPNLELSPEGALRNASGVVPAGERGTIEMLFQATGWLEGVYEFGIRLEHNAAGGAALIPVIINIDDEAGFGDDAENTPVEFGLTALYPNPFNSVVRIDFVIDEIQPTTLRLFDIAGREVATVYEGSPAIGSHRLTWDASRLASGIYIVRLESAGRFHTAKIALIR